MLLPRSVRSSTLAGHVGRSFPTPNLLRNVTARTFLRSMSSLTDNRSLRLRSSIPSVSGLARYVQPSTLLRCLWPQQSRGMKTRSSVKRLCDACKVSHNSKHMLVESHTDLPFYSQFDGKTEYTLYGIYFTGSQ
jgi:hypothetical protein